MDGVSNCRNLCQSTGNDSTDASPEAYSLTPHSPVVDIAIPYVFYSNTRRSIINTKSAHHYSLRDALCWRLRDWVTILEISTKLYWCYSDEDMYEDDLVHDRSMKLSKKFEDHVSNMINWSYDHSILAEYPELAGKVRFY